MNRGFKLLFPFILMSLASCQKDISNLRDDFCITYEGVYYYYSESWQEGILLEINVETNTFDQIRLSGTESIAYDSQSIPYKVNEDCFEYCLVSL